MPAADSKLWNRTLKTNYRHFGTTVEISKNSGGPSSPNTRSHAGPEDKEHSRGVFQLRCSRGTHLDTSTPEGVTNQGLLAAEWGKNDNSGSVSKSEGTKHGMVTWEKADRKYTRLHGYTGTRIIVTGIQRDEVTNGRRGDLQEAARTI